MADNETLSACLNISVPYVPHEKLNKHFTLQWNADSSSYCPERDDIRRILHTTLTYYERILAAHPDMLTCESPDVYVGLTRCGSDAQLSATHTIGPNIFIWINSAMYTYGITCILDGEIHAVQRVLSTPSMIFACESVLQKLIEN